MSTLKIKLCELNDADVGSIKSMFHLTASQRKHDWEIISSGKADLCIYSFESEKSIHAWQNHTSEDGMSVLFSTNEDVDVAVDIVLKKPLRTKNFSSMLNTAAKQIHLTAKLEKQSPDEIALEDIYAAESKAHNTNEDNITEKKSFVSILSGRLGRNKSPHKDLPTLNLVLPAQTEIQADLIIDPAQLKQSLQLVLASHDDEVLIEYILTNLVPLNRFIIPAKTRLSLLELYRQSTFQLMRGWEVRSKYLATSSQDNYLSSVKALASLIQELCTGYQILLMEAYEQGQHPKSKESFLLAINRVAEYSSLNLLHGYCFLRATQTESIDTLNQLYQYCETADVVDTVVSSKGDQASTSFSRFYHQIILTSIADPFRLTSVDILKLYRLMAKYTNKVSIMPLSEEQKDPANDSLTGGLFYLDLASNILPFSLDRATKEERSRTSIRLFNTQSTLTAIERIFRLAASNDDTVYTSEIQLLKKVIPHLNNSYERQFERIQSDSNTQVELIKDLNAIHTTISSGLTDNTYNWTVHNRSPGGMMVSNAKQSYCHLDVGDFYGVFEKDTAPSLAHVRWLRNNEGTVEMGLELLHGEVIITYFFLEDEPEKIGALLLRNKKQADTLIAPKGLLNIDEAIELTEQDKSYIISIDSLIDNSSNYDHFSFTTL